MYKTVPSVYECVRDWYYTWAMHVPILHKYVPVWIKGGIYYCIDKYHRSYPVLIKITPTTRSGNIPVTYINKHDTYTTVWSVWVFYEYDFQPAPDLVWSLAMMKGYYASEEYTDR